MNRLERLARLRQWLAQEGLDAVIIAQPENRRYLSGFTGSAGVLLISSRKAILVTDFRYVEQAGREAGDFTVVRVVGRLGEVLPAILAEQEIAKLGFEAEHLSFAEHRNLSRALESAPRAVELVPTEKAVEILRSIKDNEEKGLIQQAAALADAALEHVLPNMRPGIRESEVAWELERFLREGGSESLPFDIIVSSGPRSAMVHARPTEKTIAPGEPVVIDLGARVKGYVSDMTRTVCLGSPTERFKGICSLVLEAQLTAIRSLEAGMACSEVDRLARDVIGRAGYGEAFGHGLGHGVGLAAHEEPTLGPRSMGSIGEGMVFTVEPGIYIPGWGGVRIEDMVVVEGGKARVMTRAPKAVG